MQKSVSGFAFFVFWAFLLFPHPLLAAEPACLKCHKKLKAGKVIHAAVDMGCDSCHKTPHSGKKAEFSLSSPVPEICFNCHDKTRFENASVHAPVAGGMCTSCHNPHSSDRGKLLTAEAPELCFGCHDKSPFEKSFVHAPVAGGMCTSCHNPHAANLQKLLSADAPELCFGCHDKTAFTKSVVHRPVAAGKCTACHNPHAADTAPLLPEAKADFCTRCHPDKNSGKHILAGHGLGDHPMHGKADPSRPGKELSCASCHSNPHVSGKKFLFTDETKSPGSLCLLCHTKVTVKP